MQISTNEFNRILSENKLWDLGNKILYDLCENHPLHKRNDEIIAKVWLIGRAYAAAIERRKGSDTDNDSFYINEVAPRIRASDIDKYIGKIRKYSSISINNIPAILNTHYRLMRIFQSISKLNKRSLTSKYLHFHCPCLFFLFDSRACAGISRLINTYNLRPAFNKLKSQINISKYDEQYALFFLKAYLLQQAIQKQFKMPITPRVLDMLLLGMS